MAVNQNPAQVPNASMIEMFPEDFEIVVRLCQTLKAIAGAAVAKRDDTYFESFYKIHSHLSATWLNLFGKVFFPLVLGESISQRAVDQHHDFATALTELSIRTQTHQENFEKQKQGAPLIPPNYDFFVEFQKITDDLLVYFCE